MDRRRTKCNWNVAPIVEVILPSCPTCGAATYRPIRGITDDDGGRTSRRICASCNEPYIVLTLPSSGKAVECDL